MKCEPCQTDLKLAQQHKLLSNVLEHNKRPIHTKAYAKWQERKTSKRALNLDEAEKDHAKRLKVEAQNKEKERERQKARVNTTFEEVKEKHGSMFILDQKEQVLRCSLCSCKPGVSSSFSLFPNAGDLFTNLNEHKKSKDHKENIEKNTKPQSRISSFLNKPA